jgi:hypothetical protein
MDALADRAWANTNESVFAQILYLGFLHASIDLKFDVRGHEKSMSVTVWMSSIKFKIMEISNKLPRLNADVLAH